MSIFKYDATGPYIEKDPRALLDYTVDWTDWLATSAAISSSVWSADDGVVVASSMTSAGKATCWVSGGTNGLTYTIRNWIRTDKGREDARSFRLKVGNR
jgi:hypothetical protein